MTNFETILLDIDADAHVATITLNRPEQLNAFNRTMCEEMAAGLAHRSSWTIRPRRGAAGGRQRGRSAPAWTSRRRTGSRTNVWNHEDPGELLSPKWQKVWKPVVCAVQGMCTAGAFYFVNESDVVICSTDATFFDSHVSAGLVCALEPIGLMRRIGLGETLRMALMGNDERVGADTALRIGLVVGSGRRPSTVGPRPRDRGRDRRQAAVGDAGHREGDLGVAGQALPRRHGAGAHLHPAGQPDRHGRTGRPAGRTVAPNRSPLMALTRSVSASPTCWICSRIRAAIEFEGQWLSWRPIGGMAGRHRIRSRRRSAGRDPAAQPARAGGGASSGCCGAADAVVAINPCRGDDRTRADIATLRLPLILGEPDDLAALVAPARAPTAVSMSGAGGPRAAGVSGRRGVRAETGRPGVAVRMLTSGTTGPPKRIDLSYDMLARSVMGPEPDQARRRPNCDAASRSSTRRWSTSAACSEYCSASPRPGPLCLLERFELDRWADAVRRHRPRTVSLVPAALRMVLHSDLTRTDLAASAPSPRGTAPLSADDADAFTEKYGIPVLTSYAATEFGGGVAGWTLPITKSTGTPNGAAWAVPTRRAAAGGRRRRHPARSRPAGLLEVKPGQLGDVDGLDPHHGHRPHRRGRLPLDSGTSRPGDHPRRLQGDAGRRLRRAGDPPRGAGCGGDRTARRAARGDSGGHGRAARRASADAAGLTEFLRKRLARYEVPTEIVIVDAIPRTPSGKADLDAVRRFFTRPFRPSAPSMPANSDTVGQVLRAHVRSRGRSSAAGVRCRADQLCRG